VLVVGGGGNGPPVNHRGKGGYVEGKQREGDVAFATWEHLLRLNVGGKGSRGQSLGQGCGKGMAVRFCNYPGFGGTGGGGQCNGSIKGRVIPDKASKEGEQV